MKVVIFGASGFVGRNLVPKLIENSFEVVGSGSREKPADLTCEYVQCDVRDKQKVEGIVRGADFVVHLAAGNLRESMQDPLKDAETTILGSLNILEVCVKHKIKKIIFASTGAVYDVKNDEPVTEETPCKPHSPYAISKLAVENYLRFYHEKHGLNYVVFRLFNVYGPGQSASGGSLIPVVIDKISKGEEITIFGDGNATRDYVFVGDVCDCFVEALKREDIKNDFFNLASGYSASVKKIISAAEKALDKKAKIKYVKPNKSEILRIKTDITKLSKAFKKKPVEAVRWIEKHGDELVGTKRNS
ncbi:MAG: NAD-dependent epimerase/dehydratase family protein [Candidatus Micrarchaeia archaeon]